MREGSYNLCSAQNKLDNCHWISVSSQYVYCANFAYFSWHMVCPFNLGLPSFLYFQKLFWICLSFFLFPFIPLFRIRICACQLPLLQLVFVLSVITFSSLFLSILYDFLSLACAFNSTYLFSVASELTFISIIALFFIFCLFSELCQFTFQRVFFLFLFWSHISSLNFSAKPCCWFI